MNDVKKKENDLKSCPLVSICIPTFNRCDILKQSIESLISQKEFIDGSVEICVSNKESTDATEEICWTYAKRFPNFHYLGPDDDKRNNFVRVLTAGNGKLLKLSNDTIIYKHDALSFFCEVVKRFEKIKPPIHFVNKSDGRNWKNRKTVGFSEFVERTSFHITWWGALALWNEDIGAVEGIVEPRWGNLWPYNSAIYQVFMQYHLVDKKGCGLVLEHEFLENVIQPNYKKFTYDIFDVFYTNWGRILRPYIQSGKISESLSEKLQKELLYDFFKGWMLDQAIGGSNYEYICDIKAHVNEAYKNKPYFSVFMKDYLSQEREIVDKYQNLCRFCRNSQPLFIYGAGYVAKKITAYIRHNGINNEGYIVSDGHRNKDEFMGLKVSEINEVVNQLPDMHVLVAVGKDNQQEVKKCLEKNGCRFMYLQNIFP